MNLPQWECVFKVDNRRTQTTVSAISNADAKKLVEAQYAGSKISWISCTRV